MIHHFSFSIDLFVYLWPSFTMPEIYDRIIGPAMPSAELLAAAAKLTEAQVELRYLLL